MTAMLHNWRIPSIGCFMLMAAGAGLIFAHDGQLRKRTDDNQPPPLPAIRLAPSVDLSSNGQWGVARKRDRLIGAIQEHSDQAVVNVIRKAGGIVAFDDHSKVRAVNFVRKTEVNVVLDRLQKLEASNQLRLTVSNSATNSLRS